jgi:hypothetical protein
MSFSLLPGTFAWPAGIGDLIVGAYAPFVVLAISRRTPGWHKHVVLLNVLGLLDLVGAIGGGVLSGRSPMGILRGDVPTDIMQELPLSLMPTFAVPFWIILPSSHSSNYGTRRPQLKRLQHNKALHLTAFPLRSKAAGELRRCYDCRCQGLVRTVVGSSFSRISRSSEEAEPVRDDG